MADGYCTEEDVRKVLQDKELNGETGTDFVQASITGQTEWLQETTHRHWYEPSPDDPNTLLPTDPLMHSNDSLDVPSTPHADHVQMQVAAPRGARYPIRHAGPYTRVKLTRRDVQDVTELLVRDNTGDYSDWVADSGMTEGRGEDYYVGVKDHSGFSYLFLNTKSLPRLQDYGQAVTVTYDYGIEGVSSTVRRAIALKATAQLVLDDDTEIGVPQGANLVSLETRAQAMEREAEELLDIHM